MGHTSWHLGMSGMFMNSNSKHLKSRCLASLLICPMGWNLADLYYCFWVLNVSALVHCHLKRTSGFVNISFKSSQLFEIAVLINCNFPLRLLDHQIFQPQLICHLLRCCGSRTSSSPQGAFLLYWHPVQSTLVAVEDSICRNEKSLQM
jgi:hypothetical protein